MPIPGWTWVSSWQHFLNEVVKAGSLLEKSNRFEPLLIYASRHLWYFPSKAKHIQQCSSQRLRTILQSTSDCTSFLGFMHKWTLNLTHTIRDHRLPRAPDSFQNLSSKLNLFLCKSQTLLFYAEAWTKPIRFIISEPRFKSRRAYSNRRSSCLIRSV